MRKEVFVLVLALALVVAGCKPGQTTTTSSSTPFVGGTEGLRVTFVDNAPPKEVLDNPRAGDASQVMKFDVALRLENVGEQDVTTANIKTTIGGIYPTDFGKQVSELQNVYANTKLPNVAQLDGVRKDPEGDKLPGGTEEVTFKDLGYLKSLQGNNVFPLQADICYKYTTKAVSNFCMRQDMTRLTPGVCAVKGPKTVFSSGSPIHVSSLDESVGGRTKVILKFKISAVGTGSFFMPDQGTAGSPNCPKGDFRSENFVRVTVNTGVDGLTCSGFSGTPPSGNVRLSNGEASVTCIQDNVRIDALQNVNLQIEYNHLVTASTSILVKHLPSDSGTSSSLTPTNPSAACAAYQTVPAAGQPCCSGLSVCGYCGKCALTSQGGCPNAWCQGYNGATCISGTDCISGICSGGVCTGSGGTTTCSNAGSWTSNCLLCTGADSGGTWNGPTVTPTCSCPAGKTFDHSGGSGKCIISGCSSPQPPRTATSYDSYKTTCTNTGGTWIETATTGCCVCPSGKSWSAGNNGCY